MLRNQCKYRFLIVLVLVITSACAQDTANVWRHWIDQSISQNPNSYVAQQTDSTIPKARLNAASFSDRNGDLYLFGGFGGGNATFISSMMNDMWKFSENAWTHIGGSLDPRSYSFSTRASNNLKPNHDPNSDVVFPGARHHSCFWTGLNDSFWIFGGYGFSAENGPAGDLDDLWRFDVHEKRWTLVVPHNPLSLSSPAARHGASSWTDVDGNLWFFGGRSIGHNSAYFSDVWMFDVRVGIWQSWTAQTSDPRPSPRYASSVWREASGDVWIFGGFGHSERSTATAAFNDMWKLSTRNDVKTWKLVVPSTAPPACYMSSHWIDEPSGQFRLYGGTGFKHGNLVVYYDHIWNFNPLTANWELFSSSADGVNSIAKYAPRTSIQGKGATVESGPGARCGAAVWSDSSRNQTWIFGGEGFPAKTSVGLMNDLWALGRDQLAKPIKLCPFGKICSKEGEIDSKHVVVDGRTELSNQDYSLIGSLSVDAPLSLKDASISVAETSKLDPKSVLEITWTSASKMGGKLIQSRGDMFLSGTLVVNFPEDYLFPSKNETTKAKIDLMASETKISGRFETIQINLPSSFTNSREATFSADVAYTHTSAFVIVSKQARKIRGFDHFMIYWIAGLVALCMLAVVAILKSITPLVRKYEDYKARKTLHKVILVPKLPDFSPPQRM